MGRDPVELAKRAKYKPPAMRVRDVGYTKKSPFRYKIRLFKPIYNERKGDFMANKANSLSHTKWVCKYHIVFTPKYRRNHIQSIQRKHPGYYVSTVGLNEATIKKYIQEREKHDIAMDKLSVKEYEDPFKGSR